MPTADHEVGRRRCYRCLAKDHRVQECRDPIRRSECFRTGHLVQNCRTRNPHSLAKMHRAMQFFPPSKKVFVPVTKGFHTWQQQCQNAVLANVLGLARLVHFPQEMIANDFANSFRGFSNDFLIAHHSERGFVIFLLLWVRSSDLVRQGIVTLLHFQLWCYAWNPYRDAARSRITYKAWIKLVDLPFKCWSEVRVAVIVKSFGRYLWADKKSTNMHDLIGFRCQITIDDIAKIPENLAITMGDIVVNVIVQLESSAFLGGDECDIPFAGGDTNESGEQTDLLGHRIAHSVNNLSKGVGDSDLRKGYVSRDDGQDDT
uniref:DUF4283 domain-containing protein n=1 Tax=Ananas comosus var. bracteatus TaxID=296719 RepID=A0A6V7PQ55_ANACO|nr:unnamed protein product [Ananas comosus var. bracteatus]